MSVILYIDATTKAVMSCSPETCGKSIIGIEIPSGIPITLLVNQVSAFMAGLAQSPIPVVLKVTLLDPPAPPSPPSPPSPPPAPPSPPVDPYDPYDPYAP